MRRRSGSQLLAYRAAEHWHELTAEEVNAYLKRQSGGNTPAVCRASYVDPRVIDRFQAGVTIAPAIGKRGPDLGQKVIRARVERAVLELLGDAPGSG